MDFLKISIFRTVNSQVCIGVPRRSKTKQPTQCQIFAVTLLRILSIFSHFSKKENKIVKIFIMQKITRNHWQHNRKGALFRYSTKPHLHRFSHPSDDVVMETVLCPESTLTTSCSPYPRK